MIKLGKLQAAHATKRPRLGHWFHGKLGYIILLLDSLIFSVWSHASMLLQANSTSVFQNYVIPLVYAHLKWNSSNPK